MRLNKRKERSISERQVGYVAEGRNCDEQEVEIKAGGGMRGQTRLHGSSCIPSPNCGLRTAFVCLHLGHLFLAEGMVTSAQPERRRGSLHSLWVSRECIEAASPLALLVSLHPNSCIVRSMLLSSLFGAPLSLHLDSCCFLRYSLASLVRTTHPTM